MHRTGKLRKSIEFCFHRISPPFTVWLLADCFKRVEGFMDNSISIPVKQLYRLLQGKNIKITIWVIICNIWAMEIPNMN